MAKSSLSRRDFLKLSAMSASAMGLSSCSTVDRFFMGDSRNFEKDVVILGAGAAGLAAAYALKKRKIPVRMFEASSRIGGRVQTAQIFPGPGPTAELGAEFFESTHSTIFDLSKEFNLSINEVKKSGNQEAHLFLLDDKIYRVEELVGKMRSAIAPLRRVRQDLFRDQDVALTFNNSLQFERSKYYDSLSLKDLLDSWQGEVDPLILKIIEIQAVNRFGLEAQSQSSLHFLSTLDPEGSSLLKGRPMYRMSGGLSTLMQAMYERIAGVIPEHVVKLSSALESITETNGVFEMTFVTPTGRQVFFSRNVICTIPFSTLRFVDGIDKLHFSRQKKDQIVHMTYGNHIKGTFGFATPFWHQKTGKIPANIGNFTGNFPSQKFWDSGRGQTGTQGLLTFQKGGLSDQSGSTEFMAQAENDLNRFYPEIRDQMTDFNQLVDWRQKAWSLGSMAAYRPGEWTRYNGAAAEPEYQGHFVFAGEHVSVRHGGTLHGALESGFTAAAAMNL